MCITVNLCHYFSQTACVVNSALLSTNKEMMSGKKHQKNVGVPLVREQLVQRVEREEKRVAEVRLVREGDGGEGWWYGEDTKETDSTVLLETMPEEQKITVVRIGSVLVQPMLDSIAQAIVSNCNHITCKITEGTSVSHAVPVELVNSELHEKG